MGLEKCIARTGGYRVLLAGAAFVLLPFVWVFLISLKPFREVLTMPSKCFPSIITWEDYMDAYRAAPFAVYFFNSTIVPFAITAGELVITILTAYAFSQTDFKGRDALFMPLVITMIVPGEILIIPSYVTLADSGWINTYKAPILPWCISVFSIFLLKQQFSSISAAYHKVVRIDGCRRFRYLITATVLTSEPTIVVITLLKLTNGWNLYVWSLIVANTNEMRTLPVALAAFSTKVGVQYGTLMAFSSTIISPMLLVYFFAWKYIIRGVSSVGLKGW